MRYWSVVGNLKYKPGDDFAFATMHSCTFDSRPHRPHEVEFRLDYENIGSVLDNLLTKEPVFEMYESHEDIPEPQDFKSFYKTLCPGSVVYENQQTLINYLMFTIIRKHELLRRHLFLNPLSEVRHLECDIIRCMDLLKQLGVNLKAEYLSTLSTDHYGVVIKSDDDGVVIRQYDGFNFRFAEDIAGKPLHVNDRVRVYYHNPLDVAEFATEIHKTLEFKNVPCWRYDSI